jgi:hypothetical protein
VTEIRRQPSRIETWCDSAAEVQWEGRADEMMTAQTTMRRRRRRVRYMKMIGWNGKKNDDDVATQAMRMKATVKSMARMIAQRSRDEAVMMWRQSDAVMMLMMRMKLVRRRMVMVDGVSG